MWQGEEEAEAGPTFEDLAIDPELDDVARVVRYATGQVELQRLVHVLMLGDTAQVAGFEVARHQLFPLVAQIARDEESVVRQNLPAQLAALCELCDAQGGEEAYEAMVQMLLPVFRNLVTDAEQEVQEAASVSLIQVAALVREDDLMEHVLPIVLELAHEESSDSLRITSAGLMNGLAARLGETLCRQFCVPEMVSLSQDPSFKVRRAVALSMDKLVRVVGPDRLVSTFVRLANDPIWGVRKGCADSLALIAENVDDKTRMLQLVPLCESLANDPSKWVRGALSQRLGRFIASLPRDEVPDALIQRFVDMAKIHKGHQCWINKGEDKSGGSSSSRRSSGVPATLRVSPDGISGGHAPVDFATNILFCCAFSFPAVVLTRPEDWQARLLPVFKVLVLCEHKNVRRTMSYSLHELAAVLGPEEAERSLVPVLRAFLADVDEVAFGAVLSIAAFFEALAPEAREAHVGILLDLCRFAPVAVPMLGMAGGTEPVSRWRFREALARQLGKLCGLFKLGTTSARLLPFAQDLLCDDVEVVRRASNSLVGPCLRRLRLGEQNNQYQAFLDTLTHLATATAYRERQQYITICADLHADPAYAAELNAAMADALLALAEDRVPNVRLVLAEALQAMLPTAADAFSARIEATLERLRLDSDRDVALASGCDMDAWLERRLAQSLPN